MDAAAKMQTQQITYSTKKLVFLLDKLAERVLQEKLDLTVSQFRMLMAINYKKGLSQKDIASFWEVSEAAVSRQLENLKDKGLIISEKNKNNRRENILKLTKKGHDHLEKASKLIDSKYEQIYKAISQKEKEVLVGSLEKLLAEACQCN